MYTADCREAMRELPANSIDSIVTDPPYHLTTGKKGGSGAASVNLESPYGRARIGTGFMGKAWDGGGVAFTPELWAEALRVAKPGAHLLAFGGTRTFHRLTCAIEDAGWEIRDCIMWVYGSGFPKSLDISKAIDKAAGAERPDAIAGGHKGMHGSEDRFSEGHRELKRAVAPQVGMGALTRGTPATEAAKQWQGWGTAMKPAHEEIIWATKPFPEQSEQRIIVENLTQLEHQLWSLLPASAAEKSFRLSQREYEEASAFAQWSAEERSNTLADLSAQMDMSLFVSALISCLNIVMLWKSTLGASCALASTFITKTKSNATIGWSTLKSCSLDLTPRIIVKAASSQPGSWWNALPAARILNVASASISSTLELSALANAIDSGHISPPAEAASKLSPNATPIIVARKPLIGTVAANVLAHGTGGINVDACRVATDPSIDDKRLGGKGTWASDKMAKNVYEGGYAGDVVGSSALGRFPANLIHDGSEEVVNCFPETTPSSGSPRNNGEFKSVAKGADLPHVTFGHSDSGGSASRFFYCAKASKEDRGEGNNHPTVKPFELMKYLCRLVTPPGGTVLDCFMGSGSTGKAAVSQGFGFVGIDLTPEYVATASRRISEPVEAERTNLFREQIDAERKQQRDLFSDNEQ